VIGAFADLACGVPPLFEPAPMRVGVVDGSRCPSESGAPESLTTN
jgi:hypothetical protein